MSNTVPNDHQLLLDLGWRGDTSDRRLRDVAEFGNDLNVARQRFPFAQSLDEYVDGCAVEEALRRNRIFYNRTSIHLPPGGTRISRTIDTQGAETSIIGSGRGVTHLILMSSGTVNSSMPLIKHGLGDNPPGPAGAMRQFQIANLCLKCEAPSKTGTIALDLSYYEHTGGFFATSIRDVDIVGFEKPVRVRNPNRGLMMDTVGIYGPDVTVQPSAAIEVITDTYSTQHSGCGSFKSVRIANYRWGWDFQMDRDGGVQANRRSMEGLVFVDCGIQNCWGLVRARSTIAEYWSALWEFHGCDWQGYGYALDMTGCNQVLVRGGYWIANGEYPNQDPNPPGVDTGLRRYFKFANCQNVLLERMRIDVPGNYPAHVIVDIEPDCKDVLIKDNTVRDFANTAVAGFRLGGFESNTVKEIGTTWQAWSANENLKVVDVYANQVSQTRARSYGSVDKSGEYSFRGKLPVSFNANGDYTIPLPRRPGVPSANGGNETPFFLAEPVVLVTPLSELVPLRVSATSPWEFVVSGGAAAANRTIWVAWMANGR